MFISARKMDVHHDKDTNEITVSFGLPGLRKKYVKVDVHSDVLTVSGEAQSASERSEGYASGDTANLGGRFSLPQG